MIIFKKKNQLILIVLTINLNDYLVGMGQVNLEVTYFD